MRLLGLRLTITAPTTVQARMAVEVTTSTTTKTGTPARGPWARPRATLAVHSPIDRASTVQEGQDRAVPARPVAGRIRARAIWVLLGSDGPSPAGTTTGPASVGSPLPVPGTLRASLRCGQKCPVRSIRY